MTPSSTSWNSSWTATPHGGPEPQAPAECVPSSTPGCPKAVPALLNTGVRPAPRLRIKGSPRGSGPMCLRERRGPRSRVKARRPFTPGRGGEALPVVNKDRTAECGRTARLVTASLSSALSGVHRWTEVEDSPYAGGPIGLATELRNRERCWEPRSARVAIWASATPNPRRRRRPGSRTSTTTGTSEKIRSDDSEDLL